MDKSKLQLNLDQIEPVEPTKQEQNEGAQQAQELGFQNIVVVDLNNREINYKVSHSFSHSYILQMVPSEMILEIREFLAENAFTCFFTNYFLEHCGNKMSEFSQLGEHDLTSDNKIYMRPQLYNEKSARNHIKQVTDLLTKPKVLSIQQPLSEDREKLQKLQNQVEIDEETAAEKERLTQAIIQKEDENQRNMYLKFQKLIEKESKDDLENAIGFHDQTKNSFQDMKDICLNSVKNNLLGEHGQQFAKCFESINYSCFNPVPSSRRLQGDLFYITVKTLDVGEKGITCCANGFYVNNCVEPNQYNPAPSSRKTVNGKVNPAFSYTLIGCLNQVSPMFGKNLESYINQILATEPSILMQPSRNVQNWVLFEENKLNFQCSQEELCEVVNPLYGIEPKGTRDWNEEFQVVKDFPKDNMSQRVQRDRAIQKIYDDFLRAATQGAEAIVNGSITALNPNEQIQTQVYVFNSIFFSFVIDQMENFKDSTSAENNPSWTQANHDISGLRSIQFVEIDGLHYLAQCIVNYRGHRLIAQSIIPGILNNSELASLSEYGTVDEQQTIQSSENFHGMMKTLAEKLNIQVNKVIDKSGNEVEIAGCVEIKGIRGTDKRAYIVDLQGLVPRDANFLGEENHTCLVRQELLVLYQRHLAIEHAKTEIKPFEETLEKEIKEKEETLKEGKEEKDLSQEQ